MYNSNDSKYRRRELIDEEHERNIQHLTEKVKSLKSTSIEMGEEVRLHNDFLDKMRGSMSSTEGLLGSSARRLKVLTSRGSHRLLCYVVLFCVLVFVFLSIYSRFK